MQNLCALAKPLFFLLVSFITNATAEVIIIPNGVGGSLLVPSNHTMFINYYQTKEPVAPYPSLIVSSGITNTLEIVGSSLPSKPGIISGPVEIQFLPTTSHFMSYKLVRATSIQTRIVRFGTSETISVPTNKTARFFQRIPPPLFAPSTRWAITQGTNSFELMPEVDTSIELAGPLDISFTNLHYPAHQPAEAAVFSYIISDSEVVTLPSNVIVAQEMPFVGVEKSTDLQNWTPAAIIERPPDPAAFYRLKTN